MSAVLLVLILIFSSAGPSFAVPVESVHAPAVHAGEPIAAIVSASAPLPKIPDFSVEMFIRPGLNSRFQLFFLDAKYGYDVVDFEFYNAWCLMKSKPLRRNALHNVRLYNCYGPDLPPVFRAMEWNRINYIINHKKGSKEAIQEAIWHFADPERPTKLSAQASRLVQEADLKGRDYKPGEGDLIAIICQPEGDEQSVFIEYKIPEPVVPEVSPAFFAPPTVPEAVGMSFSAWVPLVPLIPIIPFIPTGPTPPPPPPPPPPVPEPSGFLLLACGLACLLIFREAGKRLKKPGR